MAKEEYLVNDIVVIPEHIKNMTREERNREIARIEKEHLDQKLKAEKKRDAS